jgi:NADH-quinone oxidoreductase subunit K
MYSFSQLELGPLYFVDLSTTVFIVGICGMLVIRKNVITILMSLELILLAVNLNFILFSIYLDDMVGQIFSLSILTVAAGESAIGLAILVAHYRLRGDISVESLNSLKG